MTAQSTVVYVAYGVQSLDLSWIPCDSPVVVVHNDDQLSNAACAHPLVSHIRNERNLGFGAAVNAALLTVETPRVILCNPDTVLSPAHFVALETNDAKAIVTVPLIEEGGVPNAVVSPYWNVPAFVATAWRLGRLVPRGGRLLGALLPLLGKWGSGHKGSLNHVVGDWSVSERWVSGAVFSISTAALRSVGGFDDAYFLYFEDADLIQRLGQAEPDLRIYLADVAPGEHAVGGSVGGDDEAAIVRRHRQQSARVYAGRQSGLGWRVAESVIPRGAR